MPVATTPTVVAALVVALAAAAFAAWPALLPGALFAGALVAAMQLAPLAVARRAPTGLSTWAVVTGGSTGIGRALVARLLALGYDVVVVARADAHLEALAAKLGRPGREIKTVGVDLADPGRGYVDAVATATADLDVRLVFLNAGVITMGDFASFAPQQFAASLEVNVQSTVRLLDVFYRRWVATPGRPASVVVTASQTGFWPCPYSTTYAATKAFVAEFALSLAIEAREHGVAVSCVLPGYVHDTAAYTDLPRLSVFRLLGLMGQTADDVARVAIESAVPGHGVVRDTGIFTHLTRLFAKVVGVNVAVDVMAALTPLFPDFAAVNRHKTP